MPLRANLQLRTLIGAGSARNSRQIHAFWRRTVHNVAVSLDTGANASPEPRVRGTLVVLAGRPGTGKSTIARLLARRLQAAYLRADVIAGSVLSSGLSGDESMAGQVAYAVACDLARENLAVDVPVVVDGVNATHKRRALWRRVAEGASARLIQLEMMLSDKAEHRRRVESRRVDGYVGPSWGQIQSMRYDCWSAATDGPRLAVDTSDSGAALARCLIYMTSPDQA
jgi:predicted kinase